jgi:hypothetical protein
MHLAKSKNGLDTWMLSNNGELFVVVKQILADINETARLSGLDST